MESSREKIDSREAPPKRSGAGYPFGETRFTTGTMYTDKLFTGQREMAGLGIYHFGARFYSPKLGRFLSADKIVPGYANPQNLNRFSYVRNNPLRYTDSTGHLIDEGCGCGNTGTVRRTGITVVAGRRTRDSDSGRTFVPWSDLQDLATRPTDIPTSLPTNVTTTPTSPSVLPTDPLSEADHYGDEPVIVPPTDEPSNWLRDFMRNRNTPMDMAIAQEVAAGIGEAAIIVTVFQPELAPVTAIVFTAVGS